MDFSHFDVRRYPMLAVQDGYREWAESYEEVVQDEMDIRLLDRIGTVDWAGAGHALDLACGTGRIGVWLAAGACGSWTGSTSRPRCWRGPEPRASTTV